jgi:DNA repair protein RecO
MEVLHTEGIVLQTLRLNEADQLATVFSQNAGLIKLVIPRGFSGSRGKRSVLDPLTKAEFIYRVGQSELYRCQETTVLTRFDKLRQNQALLETAAAMLEAVRSSQMVDKPSPELYQLLNIFLVRLGDFSNPRVALCGFLLKVLKHDGLLAWDRQDADSIILSPEEWETIQNLSDWRNIAQLNSLEVTPELESKIKALFSASLKN